MDALFVFAALRRHHHTAALVPEVVMRDAEWLDRYAPDDAHKSCPTRRIDALMFSTLERTAIEIKVSKADYRRDSWEKRAAWMRVTHRFAYAVPKGLLDGENLPYQCGVWEVDEAGRVSVLKKATINRTPEPLPQQVVQALAYRAAAASALAANPDPTTALRAGLAEWGVEG